MTNTNSSLFKSYDTNTTIKIIKYKLINRLLTDSIIMESKSTMLIILNPQVTLDYIRIK